MSETSAGSQSIATKISGADDSIIRREFLDQIHRQKLPSEKDFEWSEYDKPGNSSCRLKDDATVVVYSKSEQSNKEISGKDFNAHMLDTYGRDTVDYVGKEPDFSPFEQRFSAERVNAFLYNKYGDDSHRVKTEQPGHVEVSRITDSRRLTQNEAAELVSEKLGISKSELSEYMRANNLTWHECGDGKTVRAVPTEINSIYGHTGGIGLSKDTHAVGTVFREDVEGTKGSGSEEITAKEWAEDHKDQINEARKTSVNQSNNSEKNNAITKAINKRKGQQNIAPEESNSILKAIKEGNSSTSEERTTEKLRER